MKKVVILSTRPPYGSSIGAEAFRAGLGLAFSETEVDLILIGDGVYGALKNQSPNLLQMKAIEEVYKNINTYDINLFLDSDSAQERHLNTEELVQAQLLSNEDLRQKIDSADVVLTF